MTANRGQNHQLGDFIRSRREACKLTPQEAAEEAGLNYSYWNKLEHGFYEAPSPTTLKSVAKVLGLAIEDLYALVGYDVPERLPTFTPYLRTKYRLPAEAITQLESYFDHLRNHYGIPEGKDVFPKQPRAQRTKSPQTRPTPRRHNKSSHPWRKAAS
jgi:transcriptional regulator with XRE-family HTH domain